MHVHKAQQKTKLQKCYSSCRRTKTQCATALFSPLYILPVPSFNTKANYFSRDPICHSLKATKRSKWLAGQCLVETLVVWHCLEGLLLFLQELHNDWRGVFSHLVLQEALGLMGVIQPVFLRQREQLLLIDVGKAFHVDCA